MSVYYTFNFSNPAKFSKTNDCQIRQLPGKAVNRAAVILFLNQYALYTNQDIFKILLTMYLPYLFLFCLVSLVQTRYNKDTYFDRFVFYQFWAPQSCRDLGSHCKFPHVSAIWTIHGLWPSSGESTNYPFYCSGAEFNTSLLTGLEGTMDACWFTYIKGSANSEFWKHEWDKHGRCAVSGDERVVPDQRAYFATVLSLYARYNVSAILEKSGIQPGSEYSLDRFMRAFSSTLGNSVELKCTGNRVTGVEVCLDRNLIPINCKLSNCPNTGSISYALYP